MAQLDRFPAGAIQGTILIDPLRWLEEDRPARHEWRRGQDSISRAQLASFDGAAELHAGVLERGPASHSITTTANSVASGVTTAAAPGGGRGQNEARSDLTIRYLANQGVLLRAAGRAVLIDALFGQGLSSYEAVPEEARRQLENAPDETLRVDYVLATHGHRDHFDAHAVSRYLNAVEGARYAGPRATVDSLLRIAPGLRGRVVVAGEGSLPEWIRPLELPHGPTSVQVENVGWLVDLGGTWVLHTGDAELSEAQWRAAAAARPIDVALLPYWYFLNDAPRRVVTEFVRPREIVLFHRPLPGSEGEGLRQRGGWDGFLASVRRDLPSVRAFRPGGDEILISRRVSGPTGAVPTRMQSRF